VGAATSESDPARPRTLGSRYLHFNRLRPGCFQVIEVRKILSTLIVDADSIGLPLIREHGKTQVAEWMHAGGGRLLNPAERTALDEVALKWRDRLDAVTASCYERPAKLDALLIRPDGYVAWVAGTEEPDRECQSGLRAALERWFGTEAATP
jgi:hypothetical protein